MPRPKSNDPRGLKRRFHVWLYDNDIEELRAYYGTKLSLNEIIRVMVSAQAKRVRARVEAEVIDRAPELNVEVQPPT